jgi:hypothetical protein
MSFRRGGIVLGAGDGLELTLRSRFRQRLSTWR